MTIKSHHIMKSSFGIYYFILEVRRKTFITQTNPQNNRWSWNKKDIKYFDLVTDIFTVI